MTANEIQALYRAGLRLEDDGASELADLNYRQALKLLKAGDTEMFMALHYRFGLVAEDLGRNEDAEEHYVQVVTSDAAR
jgi:hypothetical protein